MFTTYLRSVMSHRETEPENVAKVSVTVMLYFWTQRYNFGLEYIIQWQPFTCLCLLDLLVGLFLFCDIFYIANDWLLNETCSPGVVPGSVPTVKPVSMQVKLKSKC